MENRPTFKQIATLNIINNTPMAIVMSTAAPLLGGQPLVFGNWLTNVIIAFILACIINAILPIQKMSQAIPAKFGLNPKSLAGGAVANAVIAAIFVAIIGVILTYYNVRIVPVFIFAFLATFLPLYVICFCVAMVTTPIAAKMAFGDK